MNSLNIFVDEYGDPSLEVNKDGVSGVYIICAVCLLSEQLDAAKDLAEKCRLDFFQAGEMKSSSIGPNDGRRLALLNRLSKMEFFVIAFCANKAQASKASGLKFKKTFLKFFARKMYERIFRYTSNLNVVLDKHGGAGFQREFGAYLEKRFPVDLFGRADFSFSDSKGDVLLQVADIYAGSLARIYDVKKVSPRCDELRSSLKERVSLTMWPEGTEPLIANVYDNGGSDELIRRFCVSAVESYIAMNSQQPYDVDNEARLVFLQTLLSAHAWGGESEYISTGALRREISRCLGSPISEHKFRSSVVAKLRDSDVVIASCSKGYKIPSCYEDIRDYAQFANTILPPMVSRVERASRNVREATMGKVNVLEEPGLSALKKLVEALR
ncbi:DUF3800 domain-containing protein [Lysobacter enzymogenes]|uniref:DUF3800 domain-containing protein n=1 Tax=Lysobacter enzymogenes TaxID=69 RepID=UPI001A961D63|nr:DUF3800 domain-containing protein [Lysobacter enzymogenes]QQP94444.1 DUF3800 domain-containing protein [Lysobacter enzymogenes]